MYAMPAAPGCGSFLFYPADAFYCDAFDAFNVNTLHAFFHECMQCIQYII